MRTIIAGSRHCNNMALVKLAILESGFEITEVVSGFANGVDYLGEQYSYQKGLPLKIFPANWTKYGKSAGPIRNREMADYADALIAILYPGSRGTADMIKVAKAKGLKVYVKRVSPPVEASGGGKTLRSF